MNDLILGAVAVFLATLLFVVAYYWRAFLNGIPSTPFRRQLRRSGIPCGAAQARLGALELRYAELKCGLCASRAECEAQLARGWRTPAHCPNAEANEKLAWR